MKNARQRAWNNASLMRKLQARHLFKGLRALKADRSSPPTSSEPQSAPNFAEIPAACKERWANEFRERVMSPPPSLLMEIAQQPTSEG